MQKNIIVFDTETISLNKNFIYNIGYVICDPDGKVLLQRDMVIRQIYDNAPLFATAYYAKKRPLYTSKMKARRTVKVSLCRAVLAKSWRSTLRPTG